MGSARAQQLLGWSHRIGEAGEEKCKVFTEEKSSSSVPDSFDFFPSGRGMNQHLQQSI